MRGDDDHVVAWLQLMRLSCDGESRLLSRTCEVESIHPDPYHVEMEEHDVMWFFFHCVF